MGVWRSRIHLDLVLQQLSTNTTLTLIVLYLFFLLSGFFSCDEFHPRVDLGGVCGLGVSIRLHSMVRQETCRNASLTSFRYSVATTLHPPVSSEEK